MPLIIRNNITPNIDLAVWKITETLNELFLDFILNDSEIHLFNNITNESRKIQWIATRKLLLELTKNPDLFIKYKGNHLPYLNDETYAISISHTQEYVAIIMGKNSRLGIDIEKLTPRIYKIQHKFCSELENNYLAKTENLLSHLYVIWSAKETLFKMYGKGNLDFQKNLYVYPFDFNPPGKLKVRIDCIGLVSEIDLFYDQLDNHILVYGFCTAF